MSYYSLNGANTEDIMTGPSAGHGSVDVASHVKPSQDGGAKRRRSRSVKRSRKAKRAHTKKSKHSKTNKSRKNRCVAANKSLKNKLLKCKQKIQKLRRRISKRRSMKGGAVSNVPLGAEMRVPGFSLSAVESALANPAPFVRTFEHNVDNYNHFDGSSHPTNSYNQDVVA